MQQHLPVQIYEDKMHGAWQAILCANHTGLQNEGLYLEQPGLGETIELAL